MTLFTVNIKISSKNSTKFNIINVDTKNGVSLRVSISYVHL
jgi:hypothetical protein